MSESRALPPISTDYDEVRPALEVCMSELEGRLGVQSEELCADDLILCERVFVLLLDLSTAGLESVPGDDSAQFVSLMERNVQGICEVELLLADLLGRKR
jgi:hypothetical protein